MKKKLLIFVTTLALLLGTAMPVFAAEVWYGRYAEVGNTEELQTVFQLSEGLYENYGIDAFYLYTDEERGAGSAQKYAQAVTGNLTIEPNVVVYAKTVDDAYVLRWGSCVDSIDDNEAKELITVCAEYEAVGNYDAAAITFLANVSASLAQKAVGGSFEASNQSLGEAEPATESSSNVPAPTTQASTIASASSEEAAQNSGKSTVKSLLISLVIGLIAAFIVISSIKRKYKPVRKNAAASDYLVGGSVQITGGYENYVRTDTTKREINNQNNQKK